MRGEFAVFGQWTEINSMWEGRFMESIAPGAFRKTMKENRAGMRALFQHGNDPQVGDKPLGAITDLRETDTGAAYEVQLLDAPYVRDLVLPGLEAGLYGASFRFQVMKEEITDQPKRSSYNPNGLPERVISEARVSEFGPVTFPAYPGASAGVRSLTDEFVVARFAHDPEAFGRALAFGRTGIRMDTEDLDYLADMLALAVDYINEQDEPGDKGNVAPMQDVIKTIVSLMNIEVTEVEPDEPEDEEVSQEQEGAERAEGDDNDPALSGDGAGADHSDVESRDDEPSEFDFWFARQ